MSNIFDKEKVSIACPHCKKQLAQTIGRLKTNPVLRCRACGTDIQVKADQLRAKLNTIGQRANKLNIRLE